ncbi:hypothetical protein [Streptomyces sp. NPDC058495]|uniref:hypothetical protein n=1 Tax=unclassified Streptomyces TaxID=2593676 RepID=UPI00364FF667
MTTYSVTMQHSLDQGATWRTAPPIPAGREYLRPGAEELVPHELAADVLNTFYRTSLYHDDGTKPIPIIQVFVWDGPVPQGVPLATSSTGVDSQWQATAELLREIADDISHFEEEKKKHEAQVASDQTAINNAKDRLARVAGSAARMQMPQVAIAHAARRSREWVRKTVS